MRKHKYKWKWACHSCPDGIRCYDQPPRLAHPRAAGRHRAVLRAVIAAFMDTAHHAAAAAQGACAATRLSRGHARIIYFVRLDIRISAKGAETRGNNKEPESSEWLETLPGENKDTTIEQMLMEEQGT